MSMFLLGHLYIYILTYQAHFVFVYPFSSHLKSPFMKFKGQKEENCQDLLLEPQIPKPFSSNTFRVEVLERMNENKLAEETEEKTPCSTPPHSSMKATVPHSSLLC